MLYNSNINEVKISIEKVVLKKDEELRCKLQNSIFSASTRDPLEIEDIKNDIVTNNFSLQCTVLSLSVYIVF